MTDPDTPSDPPDEGGQASSTPVVRRALRLATELCDLDEQEWLLDSTGADLPIVNLNHHPGLLDVLSQVRDLTNPTITPQALTGAAGQARSQVGRGGLVVAAHGPQWSVVARAGGPLLIVCPEHPDGARLDPDETTKHGVLVTRLITLSRSHSRAPMRDLSERKPDSA
jgi:hypothetical protein